jgi:cytochrome c oxidase subunit 2
VGPSLKGLLGKTEKVTTAGKEQTVVVDEGFIRKHILDPSAEHVEGYPPIMPKVSMTAEELAALVDYIESLK